MSDVKPTMRSFEAIFGGTWVPVKFHEEVPEREPRKLRFCEAAAEGRWSEVILTPESVTCPGARRSLGWSSGMDEGLAEELAKKQSLTLATAKSLLKNVPRLDGSVAAVGLGTKDAPDVLISYVQPPTAMKIIRAFQKSSGGNLNSSLSSVLSVCGNVAVKSFLTGEITFSFGCDLSRDCGSIGRDRLAVGVPWSMVPRLLEKGKV